MIIIHFEIESIEGYFYAASTRGRHNCRSGRHTCRRMTRGCLVRGGCYLTMTNEEKIQAVEDAIDGARKLIAEAREAFVDYFDEVFFRFYSGGVSGGPTRTRNYFLNELTRVVGEARCDDIYEEEWAKWVAKNQPTVDPEVWEEFTGPSVEGMEEYCQLRWTTNSRHDFALAEAEWIEDRKHLKNRAEYAGKFYGVRP